MDIYITLDYELFLGDKTGTPMNCLVRPMNELCKVAEKHHFKMVVFVDATYLLRLSQYKANIPSLQSDYELVVNHIKYLVKQGHDLQLHFHPQWLYSEWDEKANRWNMDRDHYKLSDLSLEEVQKSLKDAKYLLDEILGYHTFAYRAGGFCLDSFSEYKEIFKELGLRVDSSVARYLHVDSPVHSYDYRSIPANSIYNFEDSIKNEDIKGSFKELSISAFKMSSFNYIRNIRMQRGKDYHPSLVYKDGTGIVDYRNSSRLKEWLMKLFSTMVQIASIDGVNSTLLDFYYTQTTKKAGTPLVLIGHPKGASDTSISNVDSFFNRYGSVLNVKTTRDL